MDALPGNGGGDGAGPDSPSGILDAYARIHCICLAAGVPSIDADDLAQDVFLWLLRNGPLLALPGMPFLAAVVRNYIKRYRREKRTRRRLEGASIDKTVEPSAKEASGSLETKEILDRVAAVLPSPERAILALMRSGFTFPQATSALNIPRGSQGFYRGRLVEHARRELRSREVHPVPPTPGRMQRPRA